MVGEPNLNQQKGVLNNNSQWNADAHRVIPVTEDGEKITDDNPLPVQNIVDGDPVSKDNPSHFTPTDHSGRVGLMSVFGDQIVGTRIAQVSGQFKYGLPTDGANTVIVSTGNVSVVDALLTIETGVAADGAVNIANRRSIRYIPGYDTFALWTTVYTGTFNSTTGVTTGVTDSYQRTGLYDSDDGFFLGFKNETFGFTRRRLGVDTFTAIDMAAFKTREGYGLDLTKGNIFRLNYGYLGFATIVIDVLEPGGNWANLFKLEYPNTSEETHITQTFLEPRFEVGNTGNTTNVVAKAGSFNAGIIDGGGETPSTRSFTNSGSFSVSPGLTDVISYRNKASFKTFINKVPALMSWLSLAVEGNKPHIIRLILNPTIDVAGTWTDTDTNDSIMEYSIDTTYVANTGKIILPFSLAKVGELDIIIKELDIEWLPGDILNIEIETSGSSDVVIGIKWDELF